MKRSRRSASATPYVAPEPPASWQALLVDAVERPGILSAAYSAFHNYSVGNMLLAALQCMQRDLPLGPIATFQGWLDKKRTVQKGEKALVLCMPVTAKRREESASGEESEVTFTRFTFRRNWFVLAQTTGEDYVAPPIPGWDRAVALATLGVREAPFESFNGNEQGYSDRDGIHINPVAALPAKTTFHELAHQILHNGDAETRQSVAGHPRSILEIEAEAVALVCVAALGLAGQDEARGYIQGWLGASQEIPETSARRVFSCATKLLAAGRPAAGPKEG